VCIFRRGGGSDGRFELVQTIERAHDRIIWDVSWSPDDLYFATGSRDKTVKVWCRNSQAAADAGGGEVSGPGHGDDWSLALNMGKLSDSVTALDFAPATYGGSYVLAVGYDNGGVELFAISLTGGGSASGKQVTLDGAPLAVFKPSRVATRTVRRLLWRRRTSTVGSCGSVEESEPGGDGTSVDQLWNQDLAFCSIDGSVRIVKVSLSVLVEPPK
jgi:WD40 repeat protein